MGKFITLMREQTKGIDNGVTINLTGSSLSALESTANEVKTVMQSFEGIVSASTSLSDGSPRAEIVVDAVQAAAIGTTPSAVVSTVRNMLLGTQAGSIQESDEEYNIKVMYPEGRYHDVSDLSGLMISTSSGGKVPLTDVAEIVYTTSPSQIQRQDGDYQVSVTGQTATGMSDSALSNQIMQRIQQMDLPEGVNISQGGNMRMMNDEFNAIYSALATAVFLVFVVMAMQ